MSATTQRYALMQEGLDNIIGIIHPTLEQAEQAQRDMRYSLERLAYDPQDLIIKVQTVTKTYSDWERVRIA
jgi:hypothetical protein